MLNIWWFARPLNSRPVTRGGNRAIAPAPKFSKTFCSCSVQQLVTPALKISVGCKGSEKFDRNEQVKYLPGSQHIYWLPQRPSPPQHLSSARTRQKRRAREICTNFERRSCFARVSRTFDNSNRQSKTQFLRMIINFPRSRSVGY